MATASVRVEPVLKNVCGVIGEGPHWDDASQTLHFVDIEGRQVHRWNTATGHSDVVQLNDQVGFVVPRRQGGYIVGLGRRFAELDWETGNVSTIVEVDSGTGNRLNDGKCDAMGRLWAGTLHPKTEEPWFTARAGSLYSLGLDRSAAKQLTGLTVSNGLAWTHDNRTMFFVDSAPKKLYAFDFDLHAGTIANQRTVITFPADSGIAAGAMPDGMTIDAEGKLWVAFFNGGAVLRLDPETGKTLQKIDIPAKQTTSVCWGGKNLDELYVTSARILSDEEFRKQPLAGSVFKVTGLGAKGTAAYMFEG